MLDHVNPQEPAGERVNGGRTCQKECQDRAEKVGAAPEPAIPLVFTAIRTGKCSRHPAWGAGIPIYRGTDPCGRPGPGSSLSLLCFDEYTPSPEVQDFGNKTSKKHSGRDWPPICINPDAHRSTSAYRQFELGRGGSGLPCPLLKRLVEMPYVKYTPNSHRRMLATTV